MTDKPFDFLTDFAEQARSVWETGMKTSAQVVEATSKAFAAPAAFPATIEDFRATQERFVKQFAPFVKDNVDAVSEAMTSQFDANMDFVRKSFERTTGDHNADWRQVGEENVKDAFAVIRTGFDLAAHTGTKVAENCKSFLGACNESQTATSRPSTKSKN